jgi:hypothetical protein
MKSIIEQISGLLEEQGVSLVNYFGEKLYDWLTSETVEGPLVLYVDSKQLEENFLEKFMDQYPDVYAHAYYTEYAESGESIWVLFITKTPVFYVGIAGKLFGQDEEDELVDTMNGFLNSQDERE